MKLTTNKYKVMVQIDQELYDRYRKHIRLVYGIRQAGASANIMDFNARVFSEAMENLMKGKGK